MTSKHPLLGNEYIIELQILLKSVTVPTNLKVPTCLCNTGPYLKKSGGKRDLNWPPCLDKPVVNWACPMGQDRGSIRYSKQVPSLARHWKFYIALSDCLENNQILIPTDTYNLGTALRPEITIDFNWYSLVVLYESTHQIRHYRNIQKWMHLIFQCHRECDVISWFYRCDLLHGLILYFSWLQWN